MKGKLNRQILFRRYYKKIKEIEKDDASIKAEEGDIPHQPGKSKDSLDSNSSTQSFMSKSNKNKNITSH